MLPLAPKWVDMSTMTLTQDICYLNLQLVFGRIELGTNIFSEPHNWSIKGASGEIIKFIGMSFFDPDGHFFEVNQRLD